MAVYCDYAISRPKVEVKMAELDRREPVTSQRNAGGAEVLLRCVVNDMLLGWEKPQRSLLPALITRAHAASPYPLQ